MQVTLTVASWEGLGSGVIVAYDNTPKHLFDCSMADAIKQITGSYPSAVIRVIDGNGDDITRFPGLPDDNRLTVDDIKQRISWLGLCGYYNGCVEWLDFLNNKEG